ncbi:MAG: ROK family protein [Ignavibacteria bacterium]|nr:ROK family protein [Ignavibacteria bacterium]
MPIKRKKEAESQDVFFDDEVYLGIDIGASNLKYGIVNSSGAVIYQHSQSTNASKGLDYMLTTLKRLILNLQDKYPRIKAIGVGVPGIVSLDGNVKLAPNLPEWVDVPLGKFLNNVFSLPIAVDNDANAAAYAEMQIGSGKEFDSFIYVTLGTGVGGAVVINRRLYRGENNAAGEFGHIIYNPFEPLNSKKTYRTGVLEEYLGKEQITVFAKKFIKDRPESLLHTYEKTDPYFISDAVEKGDETAVEILSYVGHILGLGLTTVMNLFDISKAVVGGGVSLAPNLLLESAIKTIKERALPHIAENVKVIRATFTKDSGFIGAALLARDYEKIN